MGLWRILRKHYRVYANRSLWWQVPQCESPTWNQFSGPFLPSSVSSGLSLSITTKLGDFLPGLLASMPSPLLSVVYSADSYHHKAQLWTGQSLAQTLLVTPKSYKVRKSKVLKITFKAFHDLTSIYVEISSPRFPYPSPNSLTSGIHSTKVPQIKHQMDVSRELRVWNGLNM